MQTQIQKYLNNIKSPELASHKGQNGKLMIIGGSELFHAASKWSLDVASKFVDMVFYSSVPSNNNLISESKSEFWNGIVVNREDLESYMDEADCILIGPGMTRKTEELEVDKKNEELNEHSTIVWGKSTNKSKTTKKWTKPLSEEEWNNDTQRVVNYLLAKYPEKKWVIDAGALQMVDIPLINENCILTPHKKEFIHLYERTAAYLTQKTDDGYHIEVDGEIFESSVAYDQDKQHWFEDAVIDGMDDWEQLSDAKKSDVMGRLLLFSKALNNALLVLKGETDFLLKYSGDNTSDPFIDVQGGNPGMTKGGTGDVLAGLIAALYCTHDAMTSAAVGSYINKKAGDSLYKRVGTYFNASDLVEEIPLVMWNELNLNKY